MASKNDYLKMMGIGQWKSRYLLPGAYNVVPYGAWPLASIYTYELVGMLYLEFKRSDGQLSAEELKLLDAMLAAVNLKREEKTEFSQVNKNDLQVIMGDKLALARLGKSLSTVEILRAGNLSRLESDEPVLVTYHPSKLLEAPELKRKAWEDLKLLLEHLPHGRH